MPPTTPIFDVFAMLSYYAGRTERIRLGTLVSGISYRNVAHAGKIAATLDVLSGGRAMCGLGALLLAFAFMILPGVSFHDLS